MEQRGNAVPEIALLRRAPLRFYNELVECHFRDVGGEMTMALLIGAGILSVCFLVTWLILRRPVRQIVEDVRGRERPRSLPPAPRMAGSPIYLGPEPFRAR